MALRQLLSESAGNLGDGLISPTSFDKGPRKRARRRQSDDVKSSSVSSSLTTNVDARRSLHHKLLGDEHSSDESSEGDANVARLLPGRAETFTGVVVSSGEGVSRVVAVADGYLLLDCSDQVYLGGADATELLAAALETEESSITSADCLTDVSAVRRVKEACCYVAEDFGAERWMFRKSAGALEKAIRLKTSIGGDAGTIRVGQARIATPEIFFNPSLVVKEFLGHNQGLRHAAVFVRSLPEVIDSVVRSCPIDYRRFVDFLSQSVRVVCPCSPSPRFVSALHLCLLTVRQSNQPLRLRSNRRWSLSVCLSICLSKQTHGRCPNQSALSVRPSVGLSAVQLSMFSQQHIL
eukprot:Selendium_serpulae@DN5886_c0_g2_i2.p1